MTTINYTLEFKAKVTVKKKQTLMSIFQIQIVHV